MSKATTKARSGSTAEGTEGAESSPTSSLSNQTSDIAPPTPNPEPQAPDAFRVDWDFDIDNEQLAGGDEVLASLIFTNGAGQVKVDNFTPEALRAIADTIYDHANDMDGREFFNRTGLKRQLAKAIQYIGAPEYAVPDGLVDECERAAGIELPMEFDEDFNPAGDDEAEDAA